MFLRFDHLRKFGKTLTLLVSLFLPVFVFSENGWIPEELGKSINKYTVETREKNITFDTSVPVEAECSYPHFPGKHSFIDYINNRLESCATERFQSFVEREKSSKEIYTNDFGGCFFEYHLYPVLVLPNLISIYGFEFQTRDSPHGWTHYDGKNFWQAGDKIIELELKDLFLNESNWQMFLLQYCHDNLLQTGHGYYGKDNDHVPTLSKEDLRVFVFSEDGIMIIFDPYTVGGWADGPDTITIPYEKLKCLVDPTGPMYEVFASIFAS